MIGLSVLRLRSALAGLSLLAAASTAHARKTTGIVYEIVDGPAGDEASFGDVRTGRPEDRVEMRIEAAEAGVRDLRNDVTVTTDVDGAIAGVTVRDRRQRCTTTNVVVRAMVGGPAAERIYRTWDAHGHPEIRRMTLRVSSGNDARGER